MVEEEVGIGDVVVEDKKEVEEVEKEAQEEGGGLCTWWKIKGRRKMKL